MKKFLLITLVAVFAFSYKVNAQIGVKLGYNFAKQTEEMVKFPSTSMEDHKKSLNAFCAGIFLDKDIVPLMDIRIGLDYAPKGLRTGNKDVYVDTKINYLEVPVLAKVKLGPVYGLGGLYAAYAINGKLKGKEGTIVEKIDNKIEFNDDDATRLDYGVKFGLGVQLGLGPLHAFGQLEYSYGIANISKVEGINTHNSVLSATIGIILGM